MGSLGSASTVPSSAPPPPIRPTPSRSTKRVPDHQRRRAAVSCDHCKQRRAKCMRASPQEPCSNCIGNRIKCQSTLPRKQRVYGSVESLSLRYRALEALVRGMLQPDGQQDGLDSAMSDAPPAGPPALALDLDALYQAAADRGIPMPAREDMTPANEIFAAHSGSSTGPIATIIPTPLSPSTQTRSYDAGGQPLPPGSRPGSVSLNGTSTALLSLPPPRMPPQAPVVEEKLIPTPNGAAHYVGPSSSFRFVTSIRALVAQYGNSIGGDDEAGGKSGSHGETYTADAGAPPSEGGDASAAVAQTPTAIREDFVGLRTSKALEPQESTGDEDDDDEYDEEDEDSQDAMDGVVRSGGPGGGGDSRQSPAHRHTPEVHQQLPHRQDNRPHTLSHHYRHHISSQAGTHSPAPSPSTSRRSRSEYGEAAAATTFLPPRDTADMFVQVFFDRVHPNYPVFHRGAFLQRYEALWQHGGDSEVTDTGPGSRASSSSGEQDQVGWNCCLAMVLAFGAQALEGHGRTRGGRPGALQKRYLHVVRKSLGRLAGTTNLANIQALLLLQLYEHNAGQRNASWTFLGCASRMAVALGMHRDGVAMTGLSPIAACMANAAAKDNAAGASAQPPRNAPALSPEREARRRVWWTLYTFERNLCIILGRPSALDEAEIAVALPADNDLSAADLPQGLSASMVRLTRASWRIKQLVYPAPGSPLLGAASDVASVARHLLAELDAWHASLPAHLQPGWQQPTAPPHRRAVLMLHVQFQYARSLVTRPYVLERVMTELSKLTLDGDDGVGATATPADDAAASHVLLPVTGARPPDVHALADVCLDAAEKTLDYLNQLGRADLLDGVAWIDVYYVYHSVLVLCLDLLGRSAADKAKHKGVHGTSRKNGERKYSTPSGAPVDARRRAAVRAILQIVDRMPLAGTFRILAQVARQLAAIVGALEGLPGLFADEAKSGRSSASHAGSTRGRNSSTVPKDQAATTTTSAAVPTNGAFQSVPVTAAPAIVSTQPVQPPAVQTPSSSVFYHQQQQQQQQMQQIQAFVGGDWFGDLSGFSWGSFDTTGPTAAGASAAAAAATGSFQQAFFSPNGLPFSGAPDTTAFGEEPYMAEASCVFPAEPTTKPTAEGTTATVAETYPSRQRFWKQRDGHAWLEQ